MCKEVNENEIAAILARTFADPASMPWAAIRGVSQQQAYRFFLNDLGYLVAGNFGGSFSELCPHPGNGKEGYALSFVWDKTVPPEGGIYTNVDTGLSVDDWKEESLLQAGIKKYGELA